MRAIYFTLLIFFLSLNVISAQAAEPKPIGSAVPSETSQTPNPTLPAHINMGIGIGASLAEKPLGHPLGFIQNKIMQNNQVFKAGLTDAQHIARVYRGLPAALMTSGPSTGLEIAANAAIKKYLCKDRNPTRTETLAASCAAGATSSLTDTVINNIVLRQQNKEQGLLTTLKDIAQVKPQGKTNNFQIVRNFYRGLAPTMARNVIGVGGYLGMMPVCTEVLSHHILDNNVSTITAAAGTGVLTATLNHPSAFITTQLQSDLEKKKYKNARDVIRQTYTKEGAKAFFKGWTPRTFRYCVGAGVLFKTQEKLTNMLIKDKSTTKVVHDAPAKESSAQKEGTFSKVNNAFHNLTDSIRQSTKNPENAQKFNNWYTEQAIDDIT